MRLNKLFSDKRLATNPVWRAAVERVKTRGTKLHLMGIVSDAGVHGMLEHLYGILRQAKEDGVTQVFIHAFTDGRDTPPQSGVGYVQQVDAKCREIGVGKIASVVALLWAMDRDNRWDRVRNAYDLLTGRQAVATAATAAAAAEQYYKAPLTETQKGDEFVAPTAVMRKAPLLATLVEPDTNRILPTLPAMPGAFDSRIVVPDGLVMVAPLSAVQVGATHSWLS